MFEINGVKSLKEVGQDTLYVPINASSKETHC